MKKILITGFSGFVSRHFLEFLEKNQINAIVKGIDIFEPEFIQENTKFIKCGFEKINLLDREKVEITVCKFQPDYILHLASYSSVAFSWKKPVISFQNNTNIFINLLEALRINNLSSRILSIGSSEEYGDVNKGDLPLTEKHSLKPVSPYAVARVSQELLSKIYSNGYGLDIVMTRSFNHIGPYQKDVFVIPSIVKQLVEIKKEGSGELITGNIEIIRDFIDVRDVVSAYYSLLTQGEKGEIYNVCSGTGYSIKQIIDILCNTLDIKVSIKLNPDLVRKKDNRIIVGSNKKISSNFNWKPRYALKESLNDMISYWQLQE